MLEHYRGEREQQFLIAAQPKLMGEAQVLNEKRELATMKETKKATQAGKKSLEESGTGVEQPPSDQKPSPQEPGEVKHSEEGKELGKDEDEPVVSAEGQQAGAAPGTPPVPNSKSSADPEVGEAEVCTCTHPHHDDLLKCLMVDLLVSDLTTCYWQPESKQLDANEVVTVSSSKKKHVRSLTPKHTFSLSVCLSRSEVPLYPCTRPHLPS